MTTKEPDFKPLRSTAPKHSVLNPSKRWVAGERTDIRDTFRRIREQQAKRREAP